MLVKCLERDELPFMQRTWLNRLMKWNSFVQGGPCMLNEGAVWKEVRKLWKLWTRRMWLVGHG